MKNNEAEEWLHRLGRDRKWLSELSGYSINSLNNTFSGKVRRLNDRMNRAFKRVFLEEERLQNVDLSKPGSSVWDLVMFSGSQVTRIVRAQKLAGYVRTEDLYNDAVINFCEDIIAAERKNHTLRFLQLVRAVNPCEMVPQLGFEPRTN